MKKLKSLSMLIAAAAFALIACVGLVPSDAFAESFSVSPMNEKIALTPGEVYYGSLTVTNPGTNTTDFTFKTSVGPFSADEETLDNSVVLEGNGDYNQIVDWITIYDGEGTIAPNSSQIVHYSIDVPLDAPAGGQYAAISVSSVNGQSVEGAINIQQQMIIAYLIYADVAGETIDDGEVLDIDLTGFMFSGNIAGSSTIVNNGNSHASVFYTLQVFPVFSGEELYTNEEDPDSALVMPGATRYSSSEWDETPAIGMFNAIYTVEFGGEVTTINKLVIICPIWLLIIIIAFILLVIFWLVSRNKSHKKSTTKEN